MTDRIYVWDPLVRIFHWSLVLAFVVCYLTGEEESLTHVWSGYVIFGLIAFRVVWGFIGTKHARFSDFMTSPATAIASMKDMMTGSVKKHIGHNPAGGWMVIALLVSLLLTGLSGLKVYGLEGYGPLADNVVVDENVLVANVSNSAERGYRDEDDDNDDRFRREGKSHESEEHEGGEHEGDEAKHDDDEEAEEFWEEIHEFLANFTVLLIALHITGVLVGSIRENQNLVKAMFTGYKEGEFK